MTELQRHTPCNAWSTGWASVELHMDYNDEIRHCAYARGLLNKSVKPMVSIESTMYAFISCFLLKLLSLMIWSGY